MKRNAIRRPVAEIYPIDRPFKPVASTSLQKTPEDVQTGTAVVTSVVQSKWNMFDRFLLLLPADLSKNRLTEIPPEVCLFAPLESLNLYHNCIKCVPEAIINLQMLTYLDIR